MNSIIETIYNYSNWFNRYIKSQCFITQMTCIKNMFNKANKIIFIGNGGSQAICMHISEDLLKMANKTALSLDSTALMSCLSNDYGYDNVYLEWLKRVYKKGDVVVAVSSSGNSMNLCNALSIVDINDIVTITAFKNTNKLCNKGIVNIHIPVEDYGIAECLHHVILHIILDTIIKDTK